MLRAGSPEDKYDLVKVSAFNVHQRELVVVDCSLGNLTEFAVRERAIAMPALVASIGEKVAREAGSLLEFLHQRKHFLEMGGACSLCSVTDLCAELVGAPEPRSMPSVERSGGCFS